MAALAEARGASRRFGAFTAVSGADLAVTRGEVVGLLGANGAGKTTLVRLLLGLLRPSDGAVLLFGAAPSVSSRRRVGYVPQTLGLYAGLTVAENWAFTATAFGNSGAPVAAGIAAWRNELAGSLPLGVQRQVAFAVALSHHPELLILDEPTSGVGPLRGARLWDDIRQSADQGAGVLVTTHNMEEAEQCDRLVVMAGGRVVARGTAAEIIGDRTVAQVRCDDTTRAFALLDAGHLPVQAHGTTLRVGAPAAAVSGLLARGGVDATIEVVPANLEEAFVAMVAGQEAA
ncbi:MAG TPA: ABC transporter ATP-binding protein [Streptosporangiaceae bacterium]|nr:ABC transporter ATP-binding protein [Streptosporangiaceae bacterium]